MERVCILGAGSWGTAQSIVLHKNGYQVLMWVGPDDDMESIVKKGENSGIYPG